MNIIIAAPSSVTGDNLLAELIKGTAKIHKERSNGTFRKVHFLADGTKEREHAEWILLQRSEGRSMKAIATELHISVSAVRRTINDLLLTEEIEEMDSEELEGMLAGATEEEGTEEATATTEATTEPATA